MLCEKCGAREATVYVKNVINGDVTEHRLCAECAKEMGVFQTAMNPFKEMSHFFNDFGGFGGALTGFFPTFTEETARLSDPGRCPVCGSTISDISRTGRVGCSSCYRFFEPMLGPVIRRIHGDAKHTGAVPSGAGEKIKTKRKLAELKKELKQAVSKEEFEKAATLRDEIKRMENGGVENA